MYIILYLLTKRLVKEVELAISNFWQPFKSQFSRFKTIFFWTRSILIQFGHPTQSQMKPSSCNYLEIFKKKLCKNPAPQHIIIQELQNNFTPLSIRFQQILISCQHSVGCMNLFCNSTLSKPILSGKSLVIVFFPHYMSFLTYHGLCSNFN